MKLLVHNINLKKTEIQECFRFLCIRSFSYDIPVNDIDKLTGLMTILLIIYYTLLVYIICRTYNKIISMSLIIHNFKSRLCTLIF